jgi:ABC-type multidrug transport system fused ATPase/permease subunit
VCLPRVFPLSHPCPRGYNPCVDSVERRFWRYVAAQWKPLVVALVCSVGVTAITGYTAYLLEQVIRSMDMRDAAMLNRVSLTVLGVFALKWFFSYGQVYYLALAGQRLTAKLREDIFAHLQRLPLGFFQSRQVGAIQSIITNDVPVLQSAVLLVRDTLDAPLRIVAFLVYIFILNWRLALLALVFLPLIAVLIQRLGQAGASHHAPDAGRTGERLRAGAGDAVRRAGHQDLRGGRPRDRAVRRAQSRGAAPFAAR